MNHEPKNGGVDTFQEGLNERIEQFNKEEWESVFSTVDSSKESVKVALSKLIESGSSISSEVGNYFLLRSQIWKKGGDEALAVFYNELQKTVNNLKSEGSSTEIAILRFLQEQGVEYDRNKITETINSVAERKDMNFINASSEYAMLIAFAIKNEIPFDRDVVRSFIGKRMGTYLEALRNTDLLDPEVVEQYDSGKKKIVFG